jgi:hypothetical protein
MMLIYCCESQMSEIERETPEAAKSTRAISVISNTNLYYLAERAKQMILEFKPLTVMRKGQGYRSCPI